MKLVLAFFVLLVTSTQAFSQGVNMSSLFPNLTFPEPKPPAETVTRDSTRR